MRQYGVYLLWDTFHANRLWTVLRAVPHAHGIRTSGRGRGRRGAHMQHTSMAYKKEEHARTVAAIRGQAEQQFREECRAAICHASITLRYYLFLFIIFLLCVAHLGPQRRPRRCTRRGVTNCARMRGIRGSVRTSARVRTHRRQADWCHPLATICGTNIEGEAWEEERGGRAEWYSRLGEGAGTPSIKTQHPYTLDCATNPFGS